LHSQQERDREMDLLVSFYYHCRGVKFYDLCTVGAAWGTKLDLVKEPTIPMIHCVSRLGSLGYPVREALELDHVYLAMLQRRQRDGCWVYQLSRSQGAYSSKSWRTSIRMNKLAESDNLLLFTHTHTQHSYVVSEPYSRVPGDRNWRHILMFVSGPLHMLPRLQEMLKGKNAD
jgi:hypothetical protein